MLVVSPIQPSPVEITTQVRVRMDEVGERLAIAPLGLNPVRVEAATARSPGTAWLRVTRRTLSPPGAGRILPASSLPGHVGDHPRHEPRKSAKKHYCPAINH
jgi:hypothetical protein